MIGRKVVDFFFRDENILYFDTWHSLEWYVLNEFKFFVLVLIKNILIQFLASFSLGDSACQRNGALKPADSSSEIALNDFKKHDKVIEHDAFHDFI